MQLKLPLLNNQRDSRWFEILLGFNTQKPYTIGNYGCLISCLGMLANKTTLEVNDLLKANNAFASGGLFLWGKSGALGLSQEYLSPKWDGPVTDQGVEKMKSYLDNGKAPLCEVDFNPATSNEDMHFVVLVGYDNDGFYCADPWTGTIRSMDSYGGIKRAVIQYRIYDVTFKKDNDITLDLQQELEKVRKQRDENWNIFLGIADKLNKPAQKDVVYSEIDQLLANEQSLIDKEKDIKAKDLVIGQLKKEINEMSDQVNGLYGSIKEAQDENKRLNDSLIQKDEVMRLLSNRVDEFKTKIQELEKQQPISNYTAAQLFALFIKKVAGK